MPWRMRQTPRHPSDLLDLEQPLRVPFELAVMVVTLIFCACLFGLINYVTEPSPLLRAVLKCDIHEIPSRYDVATDKIIPRHFTEEWKECERIEREYDESKKTDQQQRDADDQAFIKGVK